MKLNSIGNTGLKETYLDWQAIQSCATYASFTIIQCLQINTTPKLYYEGIWLGLTDKAKEGQFVWDASGATANYANWVAGEPNNSPLVGGENCVQMLPGNGQWNDMLCSPSYSEVHLQQFTMCETQIKGTVGHY